MVISVPGSKKKNQPQSPNLRLALGRVTLPHYPLSHTKAIMFTVPGPINTAAVCIWKCLSRCSKKRPGHVLGARAATYSQLIHWQLINWRFGEWENHGKTHGFFLRWSRKSHDFHKNANVQGCPALLGGFLGRRTW